MRFSVYLSSRLDIIGTSNGEWLPGKQQELGNMTSSDIFLALSPFLALVTVMAICFGFAHYFDVKGQ
jgi:hypothetical protein